MDNFSFILRKTGEEKYSLEIVDETKKKTVERYTNISLEQYLMLKNTYDRDQEESN
jgi:hypothetical protein